MQLLQAYIAKRGGKRSIRKILVANNGLAAVRFIRRLREVRPPPTLPPSLPAFTLALPVPPSGFTPTSTLVPRQCRQRSMHCLPPTPPPTAL
jgi:hypothetical protein